MNFNEFIQREKYIALNAQSKKFRIVKWVVILIIAIIVFIWKGPFTDLVFFSSLALLGLSLHFFLRWKTNAWTESWGPYKKIPLNGN